MAELLDLRLRDGSRQFAALPATCDWYAVRDHVHRLSGAVLTGFLCNGVMEAWIDFTYRENQFTLNDQFGEYWFFVADPACVDDILREVLEHWRCLLIPTSWFKP